MENASQLFDAAASEYESQLQCGLSLSGESADYFIEGRIGLLRQLLARSEALAALQVGVDFGCGVGNSTRTLMSKLSLSKLVGVDCSSQSIQVARRRFPNCEWTTEAASLGDETADLVHTTGVFHHIPPDQRQSNMEDLFRWLKPGGYLAFFENNPLNPGTRWVMSRIPFDRDAVCLTIGEARKRILQAGFEVVTIRSLFYFPRSLARFRACESWLGALPLGAQYLVLARRPLLARRSIVARP